MDFDGLAAASNAYSEDGFELRTDGQFLVYFQGTPGPSMFPGSTVQTQTLKPLAATVFDLLSIDLSELNDAVGPQTVQFTGQTLAGATVTQTFTTDGPWGFQTFQFGPEFRNLTSVGWDQMDPESFLMYDRITAQEGAVGVSRSPWSGMKSLYGR